MVSESFISICLVQIWITFGLWKVQSLKQDLLKTNDNNLFLISFSWPWLFFKRVPETGKTEYWIEKKGEKNKRLCLYSSQVPHPAGAHSGFLNMKRLGILLLLPGWDDSSSQVTPPQHLIKLPWQSAGAYLYTWVNWGSCESRVFSPRTRSWTLTSRAGIQHSIY